jgi:hypothetical protein
MGWAFILGTPRLMLSSHKSKMSKKGYASSTTWIGKSDSQSNVTVDFKDDCMLEDEDGDTDEEPAPLSGNESNLEALNTEKEALADKVPNPDSENTNLLTTEHQVELNTDKQASADWDTKPDSETTNSLTTEHPVELCIDKQVNPDRDTNPDLETANVLTAEHPVELSIDKQVNPDCDTNPDSENINLLMTTEYPEELSIDKQANVIKLLISR